MAASSLGLERNGGRLCLIWYKLRLRESRSLLKVTLGRLWGHNSPVQFPVCARETLQGSRAGSPGEELHPGAADSRGTAHCTPKGLRRATMKTLSVLSVQQQSPHLGDPVSSGFPSMTPQRTLPLTFQGFNKPVFTPFSSTLSSQPFPSTSPRSLSPSLYWVLPTLCKMLPKLIGRGWVERRRGKSHTCP